MLDAAAQHELADIVAWATHEGALMNGWMLKKRLKPGFRSLFHGPPGTGKTLTASLLGKRIGAPVYRIDLSKVVSKYIGETEKNLAGLFDRAQHHRTGSSFSTKRIPSSASAPSRARPTIVTPTSRSSTFSSASRATPAS